jgi:hypothetical protein
MPQSQSYLVQLSPIVPKKKILYDFFFYQFAYKTPKMSILFTIHLFMVKMYIFRTLKESKNLLMTAMLLGSTF